MNFMNFRSILTTNGITTLAEQYRHEFWQSTTFVNVRRIRVLLIFAVCGSAALIYAVNVQNILHLPEQDNRIVLAMHSVLLGLSLLFLVLVMARPVHSSSDVTAYHGHVMNVSVGGLLVGAQLLLYAILVTKGHPIFFFVAAVMWYSSLLIAPRTVALVLCVMLASFWSLLGVFAPPAEDAQLMGETYLFSAAAVITVFLSSAFLYRSTIEEFRQRKAVEEERNVVRELNVELKAAYTEADALNHELQRRQEILEQQATEIEIFNTKLQEHNEQLRMLNNEKVELLGIVSHDLKNPLSGILGLTDLLLSLGDDLSVEERTRLLQRVYASSQQMSVMVHQLLESNRLEAGGIQAILVPCDVALTVQFVLRDFAARALAKNITLHHESEPPRVKALTDESLLRQVLDNLVSNAIKFSSAGKRVFVRVRSQNEEKNHLSLDIGEGLGHLSLDIGHVSSPTPNVQSTNVSMTTNPMTNDQPSSTQATNFIRIEIQDEGPGISADDMQKLFGKFARLSAQPTGGEHSTGLGLSIVKKLVEAMGGRVWCESELGKGATFVVELRKS
jgi:signal transduction histidine kinase